MQLPLSRLLVELKLVIDVSCVLRAALAPGWHLGIISFDSPFLVAPKCIPSEIRVLLVEILLRPVCLFRSRCLNRQYLSQHSK